jgi:hypothetical protein
MDFAAFAADFESVWLPCSGCLEMPMGSAGRGQAGFGVNSKSE